MAHAPATIICTGTYWRNAWKYQARTYRHFGWDNGTLLANMLAVSAASGLPAEIVLGFVDAEVNRLLDLDTRREVSLCLVPIGRTAESSLPTPREAPALGLETIPLSQREVEYPAMLEMHDASSLESEEEVAQWRGEANGPSHLPLWPARQFASSRLPEEEQPKDTIEQVILRRGSTRTFDKTASITLAQLSTILDCATRGLPADFLEPPGAQLNDLYLIVHSVQGLKPGAYFFRREQNTLELLKEGEFRAEAHHLGLEQELPADACVDIFFLADLKRILERYGNRGYRAVQLEAGAIGGRIYLAAYAQHLGATGLTFFDDDVINFFSPHAKDKSAIFLLAIGKPLKREPYSRANPRIVRQPEVISASRGSKSSDSEFVTEKAAPLEWKLLFLERGEVTLLFAVGLTVLHMLVLDCAILNSIVTVDQSRLWSSRGIDVPATNVVAVSVPHQIQTLGARRSRSAIPKIFR